MNKLSENEIQNILSKDLIEWKLENNKLLRKFKFKDFKSAFSFMTLCALKCEQMDHHPDWKNVYNQLEIELYTHSIQGISKLDIELATFMEKEYKKFL